MHHEFTASRETYPVSIGTAASWWWLPFDSFWSSIPTTGTLADRFLQIGRNLQKDEKVLKSGKEETKHKELKTTSCRIFVYFIILY